MTIVIISILVIAGLGVFANRIMPVKICPPCAGVAGTWLWMLGARAAGYAIDQTFLALLIGGSIVGISYQIAQRLPHRTSSALFRTLFTVSGFIAGYGIAISQWSYLAIGSGLALISTLPFFKPAFRETPTVTELEKKLDNCCS